MSAFSTLPYLVFAKILNIISPIETLKLAMSDEKVFERLAKLPRQSGTTEFDVNMEKKMVELKFQDASKNFRIEFDASKTSSATTLVIPTGTSGMLNFVKKLRMLFPGTIGNLLVDLKNLEEAALKKLENFECEKLSISGIPRRVSKKIVAQIISTIKPRNECVVDSDLGIKLLPSPPMEKLNINFSAGINGKDLSKLIGVTKFIELAESQLEARDINGFIKQWLQGTETTTSFLQVSREDEEDWNVYQALKDVPTIQTGTIKRDVSYIIARTPSGEPLTAMKLTGGIDIQRSDGLLATIGTSGSIICFCVWHKRNEIGDLVQEHTERSFAAEEKCAQLAEQEEDMKRRILENDQRIQDTQKQVEDLEKKTDEQNIGMKYVLRYLRADIKDFEAENQRIRGDLEKNAVEVLNAEEERKRIVKTLGTYLVFM